MIGRSKSLASKLRIFSVILPLSFAFWGQAGPTQRAVVSNLAAPRSAHSRLELGQTVRQQIAAGQSNSYFVSSKVGQFARIVVFQPPGATVLRLFSPIGDEKLFELSFLSPTRRREPLCWVAKESGEYRLEITAIGQTQSIYEYEAELTDLRDVVSNDEKRIAAQQLFEQARSLKQKKDYPGAASTLEKALTLSREANDRDRESAALSGMGDAYSNLNQYEKAAGYHEQSLAVAREAKDRLSEENSLADLANAYMRLSQFEKALDYYEHSLAVAREIQDRPAEALLLKNIGNVNHRLSHFDKAISCYEQSLAIAREIKDRQLEGATLGNLGAGYYARGQLEKAVGYYEQSLAIAREIKDRRTEGSALGNLGVAYFVLRQYEKAIANYEQVLAIFRETNDQGREETTLVNLGIAYVNLNQYQKAIDYYQKSLTIAREMKNRHGEGEDLVSLGAAYYYMKQYDKAIQFSEQALTIVREVQDRQAEGVVLDDLGGEYAGLKKYDKAIGYYQNALVVEREVKDRVSEIDTLAGLMETWKANDHPRLAVFYGKQAVNTVQGLRSDIHGLSTESQESFLKGHEEPYHTLADLLIAQGRLVEAEEVLNLLKQEEYFDFVRRDSTESSSLTQHADLTLDEAAWEKRYREIGDKLVALGTERGELLDKKDLTPEETKRLVQLDQDLVVGNAAFEKFLTELAEHFSTMGEATARVAQLRETQGIMEDLRELPKGTVAIYTLVGEDKYRAILVTPDVQRAYEYPIKAVDLNRKVLAFRQATEDPKLDPRPQGQEMYKILVANIADDLKQAKAETVMWSLDGALRYLPVAALYDGKQYLVEQYALSVFTPASNARLKDRPDRDWTAAGFGVTKAHEGASALPDVATELSNIIAEKRGQAILQGEVRLDDQFTEDTMRQTLLKHYPVVHIASHFRFEPGNETNSFLLLGDGSHLSVAELKNLPNLFNGVQLLTLSACNTGVGDTGGDGKEVEGLGVLAQRKGAKAVVASLWSVADESTSLLMQELYRTRESATTTKVEALREAQLTLLRGTVKSSQNEAAKRELLHEEVPKVGQPEAPSFVVDPKAPYAHPYYWAPFFLMGNWL
jgi:CHAT domain-containing protein/uncharacterized protein HemY